MKIVRLQVEGFKRLVAVDITPEGDLVEVRGNNAEGKSSVLDAIFAALGGAAGVPIKPVRTGEEYAIIRADLGDLKVTRYFSADGTDRLKVENGEGASYAEPQTMLNKLVGRIAFDPLAFSRMKAGEQAAELRRLVPLGVDLDALAAEDKADTAARRDVNRDAKALKPRFEAIILPNELPERPDREAIVAAFTGAADKNRAIDREGMRREERASAADMTHNQADMALQSMQRLRREAEEQERLAIKLRGEAEGIEAEIAALPPLDEPADTAQLSADLEAADRALRVLSAADNRAALVREFEGLRAKSEGYTTAIEGRAKARRDALAAAEMPVPGLSLAAVKDVVPGSDSEELIVTLDGEPFAQASGAQQLRASMALGMAANPKLRVMTIKDGSLLDPAGLQLVRELAGERGYQIWMEAVGEGDGVGIIMEAGKVRGAPEPERVDPPKRRKAKAAEAEGAQQNETDGAAERERVVSPGDEFDGSGIAPNDPKPARRKPAAMREFTSKPLGGDLFTKD